MCTHDSGELFVRSDAEWCKDILCNAAAADRMNKSPSVIDDEAGIPPPFGGGAPGTRRLEEEQDDTCK